MAELNKLPADTLRLTLDPQGAHRLSTLDAAPAGGIVIAIGPEGGWSPRDRDQLAAAGFQGLQLGPRILRRDFAPGFFVEHFVKDLGLALGEARRWGHAYTLFPEIVRTPLLMHVPARLRARWWPTALPISPPAWRPVPQSPSRSTPPSG